MREFNDSLYTNLPNFTIGFHGCNQALYEKVIAGRECIVPSSNKYDWLGNGIYFWENSYSRAYEWAIGKYKEKAAVIGAILVLGNCLDLMDYKNSKVLKDAYKVLQHDYAVDETPLPVNTKGRKNSNDNLKRDLDCAVIEYVHLLRKLNGIIPYDSVRNAFIEGKEIYPGSDFRQKTHIQICIRNTDCIKGYFAPLEPKSL